MKLENEENKKLQNKIQKEVLYVRSVPLTFRTAFSPFERNSYVGQRITVSIWSILFNEGLALQRRLQSEKARWDSSRSTKHCLHLLVLTSPQQWQVGVETLVVFRAKRTYISHYCVFFDQIQSITGSLYLISRLWQYVKIICVEWLDHKKWVWQDVQDSGRGQI
jgi:hypothetical protein